MGTGLLGKSCPVSAMQLLDTRHQVHRCQAFAPSAAGSSYTVSDHIGATHCLRTHACRDRASSLPAPLFQLHPATRGMASPAPDPCVKWALAIHGGAGVIRDDPESLRQAREGLNRALDAGKPTGS